MELVDKRKLREILLREQAKYILSDRMTDKHISAGFMLAIAELDSQPVILHTEEGCELESVRLKRTTPYCVCVKEKGDLDGKCAYGLAQKNERER